MVPGYVFLGQLYIQTPRSGSRRPRQKQRGRTNLRNSIGSSGLHAPLPAAFMQRLLCVFLTESTTVLAKAHSQRLGPITMGLCQTFPSRTSAQAFTGPRH